MAKKFSHKKQIAFFTLIIALGGAMYLNWYYLSPQSKRPVLHTEEVTSEQTELGEAQYVNANVNPFFEDATLKRSKSEANAKAFYEQILENENISVEEKEKAQKNLLILSKNIKMQSDVENLILAKTGNKSIVILNETAEVILEKGKLNNEVALQIKDILISHAKIPSEKITLVEAK